MPKDYKHEAACHVDGCHKDIVGAGLCSLHYQRKRRTGTTDARVVSSQLPCSIDGCDKKQRSSGLCYAHYLAKQRHGDPTIRLTANNTGRICEIDGCREPVYAKQLCRNHYANYIHLRKTQKTINAQEFIQLRNGGLTP